ncbi:MAG: yjjX [Bacillales bacterium]|jgi:inosine/xanthosine triphosphatase|nr:yjjX [Bacillales bacterium]
MRGNISMKIGVGSQNPTKVNAVRNAFTDDEVIAFVTESGVSPQPMSVEETVIGALNRAKYCLKLNPELEFAIGLEGGVNKYDFGLFLINWGALVDKNGVEIIAGGSQIKLPDTFFNDLRLGIELKDLLNNFCEIEEINKKQGAIGIFTNNESTRIQMFSEVVKLLKGQYDFYKQSEGAHNE